MNNFIDKDLEVSSDESHEEVSNEEVFDKEVSLIKNKLKLNTVIPIKFLLSNSKFGYVEIKKHVINC